MRVCGRNGVCGGGLVAVQRRLVVCVVVGPAGERSMAGRRVAVDRVGQWASLGAKRPSFSQPHGAAVGGRQREAVSGCLGAWAQVCGGAGRAALCSSWRRRGQRWRSLAGNERSLLLRRVALTICPRHPFLPRLRPVCVCVTTGDGLIAGLACWFGSIPGARSRLVSSARGSLPACQLAQSPSNRNPTCGRPRGHHRDGESRRRCCSFLRPAVLSW